MTTITLTDQVSDNEYRITDFPENHDAYITDVDVYSIRNLLSDLSRCIFNTHALRTGAWDLLSIHDVYRYTDHQLIEKYARDIATGHLYIYEKQ